MERVIGLPPQDIMQSHCGAPNNDPWHYLSCVKRRKNELNMRHDQVNYALALFAMHAGIVTRIEPNGLSKEDRLKPDLQLIMDQFNKLIDVTVVHPTSPSYLKQAQIQLKTASAAWERKSNKYRKFAEHHSAEFIIFCAHDLPEPSRRAGHQLLTRLTIMQRYNVHIVTIRRFIFHILHSQPHSGLVAFVRYANFVPNNRCEV